MNIRFVVTTACGFGAMTALPFVSTAVAQNPFPEAPGREAVFLACSQCHSIGKMVGTDLTRDDWEFVVYDMIGRGAPVPDDDMETVIRYLQDSFGNDED